jgi:hypothetical protein
VEGIAHSRRGLLSLVLEIASGVHHLGLHLLGFSLGLHRFIAAQGTGCGLQTALCILGGGLDESSRLMVSWQRDQSAAAWQHPWPNRSQQIPIRLF